MILIEFPKVLPPIIKISSTSSKHSLTFPQSASHAKPLDLPKNLYARRKRAAHVLPKDTRKTYWAPVKHTNGPTDVRNIMFRQTDESGIQICVRAGETPRCMLASREHTRGAGLFYPFDCGCSKRERCFRCTSSRSRLVDVFNLFFGWDMIRAAMNVCMAVQCLYNIKLAASIFVLQII